MKDLDISFEQATWDRQKNELGKPHGGPCPEGSRRSPPVPWGYEFHAILDPREASTSSLPIRPGTPSNRSRRGILCGREAGEAAPHREVREAWLAYLSRFPMPAPTSDRPRSTAVRARLPRAGRRVRRLLYKLSSTVLPACCGLADIAASCCRRDLYRSRAKRQREMLFTEARRRAVGSPTREALRRGRPFLPLGLLLSGGREHGLVHAPFRIHPRRRSARQLAEFSPPKRDLSLERGADPGALAGSFAIPEGKTPSISPDRQLYRAPLLGGEPRVVEAAPGAEFTRRTTLSIQTRPVQAAAVVLRERIQPFLGGLGRPQVLGRRAEAGRRSSPQGGYRKALDYGGIRLGFRDLCRRRTSGRW